MGADEYTMTGGYQLYPQLTKYAQDAFGPSANANDAFTAGVRPGGLTSSTEIRLLLCYLVKNAGPITRQEIENA